jgi:hypothetical protein
MYLEDTNKSKWINKEIKQRLKSGNACYLEVGNLLRSRAPSEDIQLKIPAGLYKCLILPAVLSGSKIRSLTVTDEHKQTENKLMTTISVPKGDEAIKDCRNLLNEELHNLHSSVCIGREINTNAMEIGGTWGEMKNAQKTVANKI